MFDKDEAFVVMKLEQVSILSLAVTGLQEVVLITTCSYCRYPLDQKHYPLLVH